MLLRSTPASAARLERRKRIIETARGLVGSTVDIGFDPVHSPLCAIDVVMVAGAPWLRDGIERDFFKDESGYRKIGGGANTPQMAYFFRSSPNLIHYLKRQGFYTPHGIEPLPTAGMACFFDWDDRGRFNFAPDRSGIVTDAVDGRIRQVVMARKGQSAAGSYVVELVETQSGDGVDRAIIGCSDLP